MKLPYIKYPIHHLFAVITFLSITLLYCWPTLNGKKINQSDYKQFLGMSKEIVDYRNQTGEEALWTNSMFGGMPAYQISVFHPNNILIYIDHFFQLYLPRPIGIMFLYFIGFYIFLLSLKIKPDLAILGSLAFGLSSYFLIILEVGHNTKAHAISYMAPAIAGMIYTFRKVNGTLLYKIPGFFISFLFLGLHLRANHLQITYYFLFILFAFWMNYLIRSIKTKDLSNFFKSTLTFLIAGFLAISINLGNIWTTYEYSKYTTRGNSELTSFSENKTSGLDKDYATSYSYGKLETFNLLFPNFLGGSSASELSTNSNVYNALRKNGISKRDSESFMQAVPTYFGPQGFTAGPVYLGAVVWLLFFIGLFTIKKPIKWILVILISFSFILAWGKHFPFISNLFLDYFPLYNKFRTVSMILIIAQFAIPLMAIIGLNNFINLQLDLNERKKILIKSWLILVSVSIFFLLFGKLLLDFQADSDTQLPKWFLNALIEDRIVLFKTDIFRSLLFISLAFSLLYFVLVKNLYKQKKWIYILSFLVLIDMWFVDKRYFKTDDFVDRSQIEKPFQIQSVDKSIKQDTSIYRVYNLNERLDQGARTSYFHHSLGGYHGAKLGKYQEMIDMHISRGNIQVLNMLNTKYIISSDSNRKTIVQENPSALGNAWFIKDINWVDNADQEILSLNKIDTKQTATINKKYKSEINDIAFNSIDSIKLTSYSPNTLIYNSNTTGYSLAVFSEIFYPKGWQAYIDGVAVNHFPVNYILRGLVIPSGLHEIKFEFKPKSFFVSSKIAFASSFLLIFSGLLAFVIVFFKQ